MYPTEQVTLHFANTVPNYLKGLFSECKGLGNQSTLHDSLGEGGKGKNCKTEITVYDNLKRLVKTNLIVTSTVYNVYHTLYLGRQLRTKQVPINRYHLHQAFRRYFPLHSSPPPLRRDCLDPLLPRRCSYPQALVHQHHLLLHPACLAASPPPPPAAVSPVVHLHYYSCTGGGGVEMCSTYLNCIT